MAALSAAAAIPFAGWAATGAKAAIKGTASAEKLTPWRPGTVGPGRT